LCISNETESSHEILKEFDREDGECLLDDAAGHSATRVAGLQAVLVSAQSHVIHSFMYNNGPAKDGVGATEQGQVVANVEASSARQPSLYVTQVSNVSCICIGSAVIVLEWVEMSPCGFTLVSDVTKLVDMEPVQAWGQTRDGSAEARCLAIALLYSDFSSHIALSRMVQSADSTCALTTCDE